MRIIEFVWLKIFNFRKILHQLWPFFGFCLFWKNLLFTPADLIYGLATLFFLEKLLWLILHSLQLPILYTRPTNIPSPSIPPFEKTKPAKPPSIVHNQKNFSTKKYSQDPSFSPKPTTKRISLLPKTAWKLSTNKFSWI